MTTIDTSILLVTIIVAATFSCCLSVELSLLLPDKDNGRRNKYDVDTGIETKCEEQQEEDMEGVDMQQQHNIHKHYTMQHEGQQQQRIQRMLEKEQQRLKQVKELVLQQFNGQLSMELQKQQQQQQQHQQFDPFYFANLRWLQQHEKEHQRHQQQIVEHNIGDSHNVNDDEDDDDDDDDDEDGDDNKNNSNKKKSNYAKNKRLIQQSNISSSSSGRSNTGNPKSLNMYNNGQSHSSASNNNNNNYKEHQHQHHQQQQPELPQQQQLGQEEEHFDVDPQDARNDFRLQLSDLNEAVKSVGAKRRSAKVSQNKNNYNNIDFNNDVANNNNNNNDNDALTQANNNNEDGDGDDNDDGNGVDYDVTNVESFMNYNPRRTNINAMQMADYAVTDSEAGNANYDVSGSRGFNNEDNDNNMDNDNPAADDDDELAMNLLYGIQNVRRKRGHKEVVPNIPDFAAAGGRSNSGLHHSSPAVPTTSTTYQSLCLTKRVSIPLETEAYKYRPSSYIEVTCAHNYAQPHLVNDDSNKNKVCSSVGFSCIQLNRTIHLIRRSKTSPDECWEPEMRIVPSGCECMWPRHSYGDIGAYHQHHYHERPQKRFNQFAAKLLPRPPPAPPQVSDYKPGLGYRQLWLQDSEVKDFSADSPNIGYEALTINKLN